MDKGVIAPMMVHEKRKPKLFSVGSYLHAYFDVYVNSSGVIVSLSQWSGQTTEICESLIVVIHRSKYGNYMLLHITIILKVHFDSSDCQCSRMDTVGAICQYYTGVPNVNFWKICVRKTIWDLEFSEHLL